MQHVENELDITLEKLTQTTTKLDEKDKAYAVAEGEIQALKRKISLLEDELERWIFVLDYDFFNFSFQI
jgi:chromosome segregation ATPase